MVSDSLLTIMSITLFLDNPSVSNFVRNSLWRFTKNSNFLPFENMSLTYLLDMASTMSLTYSLSKLSNSLAILMRSTTGSHHFLGLPIGFLASGNISLYFREPTLIIRPVASFLTYPILGSAKGAAFFSFFNLNLSDSAFFALSIALCFLKLPNKAKYLLRGTIKFFMMCF